VRITCREHTNKTKTELPAGVFVRRALDSASFTLTNRTQGGLEIRASSKHRIPVDGADIVQIDVNRHPWDIEVQQV